MAIHGPGEEVSVFEEVRQDSIMPRCSIVTVLSGLRGEEDKNNQIVEARRPPCRPIRCQWSPKRTSSFWFRTSPVVTFNSTERIKQREDQLHLMSALSALLTLLPPSHTIERTLKKSNHIIQIQPTSAVATRGVATFVHTVACDANGKNGRSRCPSSPATTNSGVKYPCRSCVHALQHWHGMPNSGALMY